MTLTAQMIQSVTSIFQLLAAPLIFIYEDGDQLLFRTNLIDTKLRDAFLFPIPLINRPVMYGREVPKTNKRHGAGSAGLPQ